MDKDQLKQYIQDMQLEPDFETLLFQAVDDAESVDDALVDKLADMIDAQADIYEEEADFLQRQTDLEDAYYNKLEQIDGEEAAEKAEALLKSQEALLRDFKTKLTEVSGQAQDSDQMDQLRQQLAQQGAITTESAPAPETPQQ